MPNVRLYYGEYKDADHDTERRGQPAKQDKADRKHKKHKHDKKKKHDKHDKKDKKHEKEKKHRTEDGKKDRRKKHGERASEGSGGEVADPGMVVAGEASRAAPTKKNDKGSSKKGRKGDGQNEGTHGDGVPEKGGASNACGEGEAAGKENEARERQLQELLHPTSKRGRGIDRPRPTHQLAQKVSPGDQF